MTTPGSIRRGGMRPSCLLGLIAVLLSLLAAPRAALAHALDEYLHATYITVAPTQIVVELALTPGVLVAPDVLMQLDPDGDQQIASGEGQAYVDAVLGNVALEVDGQPLALQVTTIEMPPYLNIQTGYGTIRIFTTATLPTGMTGTHQTRYTNSNTPTGAVYQVNAFVDTGVAITLGKQNRDRIQQSIMVDYAIGSAASGAAMPATTAGARTPAAGTGTASVDTPTETPAGASKQARQLLAYMNAPAISPWVLLLGLALAAVLGGLHALTPGHGKTLVAAYLIGSRGTVKDAVVLGGTVTLTHTASVLVFGALALAASHAVSATMLASLLELCAALLVLGLGARLVWVRWRARTIGMRASLLGHTHPHPHALPPGHVKQPRGLISLGVAGGALPCPEALAILLVAVGLGRIGLGVGLLVSFSLGLATVLIALGVLLVRVEGRLKRWTRVGSAWQQWLPLGSAAIVMTLGAAMLANVVVRNAALPSTAVLALAGAGGVFVGGYSLALLVSRWRSMAAPRPAGAPSAAGTAPASWLPPRYHQNCAVSAAPMGAAPLKFDTTGAVAWDTIWADFCDLALAGGPPHRATLLEPASPDAVRTDPDGYARVMNELARGLHMVTDLEVVTDAAPGWIGLCCTDDAMALWLLRAIVAENVAVRREGAVLFLPAGPTFRLDKEIKNVVTAVAKTHHYWTEHTVAPIGACPNDT